MQTDIALKLFTLGVRFGHKHAQLGLDIKNSSNEYLTQFLFEGFKEHQNEIATLEKQLNLETNKRSWYVENWTAKQSFRWGCIAGFEMYPKTKLDKKGKRILDEYTIDELVKKQFRNAIEFK